MALNGIHLAFELTAFRDFAISSFGTVLIFLSLAQDFAAMA